MIKPIETIYRGYKFRSRLEARWAVYFDNIGLSWDYEKEGWDLGDGIYYLPDFWLSQVEMWAEVKPGKFSEEELEKVKRLVKGTDYPCILLEGSPACRCYDCVSKHWIDENDELIIGSGNDVIISNYHDYPQTENRFYGCYGHRDPFGDPTDFAPHGQFEDVGYAVIAAKQARFEFKEGRKWRSPIFTASKTAEN